MNIKFAALGLCLLCGIHTESIAADKIGAIINVKNDCKDDVKNYSEKTYSDDSHDGIHDNLVIKWCDATLTNFKLIAPTQFSSQRYFKSNLTLNTIEKDGDGNDYRVFTFIDSDTLGRYLFVEEKTASDTCRIYSFFSEATLSKINNADFDSQFKFSVYPVYSSASGLYIQYFNPDKSGDWNVVVTNDQDKVFLETTVTPGFPGWNIAFIPGVQLPLGVNYKLDLSVDNYAVGGTIRLK